MKKTLILIGAALVVFGGLIWLSIANKQPEQAPALSFAMVQQDVGGGAKLYDVRTAEEYTESHFEGATNWSLQDMQAGKLPDVPKDTKIYVYCHSGNRSSQATTILRSSGYTNVTDLHGLTSVEAIGGHLITN